MKFGDRLLVDTDFFYHFRGLVLCNAKRLQFNRNKKQEHRGTVKQVLYYPMLYWFKLIEFLVLFAPHKEILIATAPLSFLMDAG